MAKGKSYIKDTTDFLNKLDTIEGIKEDSLLVSLDVTSLYTNIPNKEGIEASYQALLNDRGMVNNPSNLSIAELLTLVLTLNNFRFNEEHYLQIGGTAMGTRLAPSFANIYMNSFEDAHVYNYHLQPNAWFRYIDVFFMVWNHGHDELHKFVHHLNNACESISFSIEISRETLNFLDVTVVKRQDRLETDLYVKPTDRNTYLPYNSAHPKHCMKGLPYGQFLRIRRICTRTTDFERHAAKKAAQLLKHKYPRDLLLDSMMRAWNQDRIHLLTSQSTETQQQQSDKIFLTTCYNQKYGGLRDQVESTWDLLGRSCSTRFIQNKNLVVGYRRPKNMRDLLVKARLPPSPNTDTTPKKKQECVICENPSCRYCQRINTSGKIHSARDKKSHNAMRNVNCHSNNLVYCITCKQCHKQYVGQTKNSLRQRFVSHFYLIGHKKMEHEVPRHCNAKDHRGIHDVEIHVLEFIKIDAQTPESKSLRLKTEFSLIQRLRTQIPLGMNTIDSDYL